MGNTELSKTLDDEINVLTPNRWRENHGNLLLGVVGIILAIGGSIIACRQSRLLPPSFPIPLGSRQDLEPSDEELLAAGFPGERQIIAVKVIGAASDEGSMRLAVYISPDGFNDPEKALGTDSWQIRDGVCEGRFGLPAEITELAIAAYHDANNNGKLDRNAIGIPSERYGFTANARGITGPPTYEEALVPLTGQPIEISIR
jgi:uncharacterized protein (DUF2141 family)